MNDDRIAPPPEQKPAARAPGGGMTRRGFLGTTAIAATAASLAQADDSHQPNLFAYPDRLSYAPGETLRLHTSTNAATYDVTIERVGAAREVVWSRKGVVGREHPIPEDASANGCRWPVALQIPIGDDWRSGYYEVVTTPDSHFVNHTGRRQNLQPYFVVRPPSSGAALKGRRAKILLQLSTNTDNAYNNWGGYSLYAYNGRDKVQGRRVSFARPMPGACIRRWELPFIEWCETQGIQLDYAVNNDLEMHPELLDRRQLVVSVGHDEYWSKGMRDQLEAFIAGGGNVAFFSGNVACWQVRNEDNGLVCFKEYYRDDPLYRAEGPNPQLSTLWSHYLIDRPENTLTGVGVLSGGFHKSHGQYMDGSGAFTVHRPGHWVFAGTGVGRGDEFGGEQSIVGYECDGCAFEMRDGLPTPTGVDRTPSDFEILATGPAKWGPEATLTWYERWPEDQQGAACLGLHQHPGGGVVFTVGATDWSHGLGKEPNPIVARITRNVLEKLS
ncbi:MAG: twin-arginine translocation signal domain-containing protein [Pirellulaceae bacterium]